MDSRVYRRKLSGEPYDFRRTGARDLVQAGLPEKTAMMITGRKTRSSVDR